MHTDSKIKLLAVVGPTASGKSALALSLAERLGGEIISCDSMQVYRRMDIGTAKPSEAERAAVRHHLIDVAAPFEAFNSADYVALAGEAIASVQARGALPILCGGTGLYLDALLRGGFADTACEPDLRERLFAYAREKGNEALHQRLAEVDPESAAATHANNVKRVVRALEIFESTGRTKSELDRETQSYASPYDATVIGLFYSDRAQLYERINRRVDAMMDEGLLAETRALAEAGVFEKNATAAQAIGYKELLGYLAGEESLTEATERLKAATRRYAKRQMTWFGAKPYVKMLDVTPSGVLRSPSELLEAALSMLDIAGREGESL